MLSRSPPIMTQDEYAKIHCFCICSLPSWKYPQSYKQEHRELKQWARTGTLQNTFISCGNATTWFICHENKRNVGICWAKSFTGFKLDATYANIMQHSPTWCTNELNMLCQTCWHNMLRSFARALSIIQVHVHSKENQLRKPEWQPKSNFDEVDPIADKKFNPWLVLIHFRKQRGREHRRERYKTIDLVTEYNHCTGECNHLATFPPSSLETEPENLNFGVL